VVLGRAADLFDLVTAGGERPAGDGGNTGTLHPSGSSLFCPPPGNSSPITIAVHKPQKRH
jgi:hypothetical protein